MDIKAAQKIAEEIHFMPSWRFEAFPLGRNVLAVSAVFDTVNSDRDQAIKDYPQDVTLERKLMIYTDEYENESELEAALFTWIIEILFHESR